MCLVFALQGKIEGLLCRRNEVLEAESGPVAAGEGAADNAADFEVRISDAHRKVESMRKRFERLCTVCISADQALKGVLSRAKVALREMHPSELTPASKIPQGTPPRATKRLERKERCAGPQLKRLWFRLAVPCSCGTGAMYVCSQDRLHSVCSVTFWLVTSFSMQHDA